jgi:hypothetical protein
MKEADKTEEGDSVGFVDDDCEAYPLGFALGLGPKRKSEK